MAIHFHHAHLFASNLDESLQFYGQWFDATVVADQSFAGSRNVMVQVGSGRLNFYDQPPRNSGRSAVHHLGFQVDDLATLAARMGAAGLAPGPVRELAELDYFMVEAPDSVLLEVFQYKLAPGSSPTLDAWFE